jgi:hypothetical protein
MVRPAYGSGVAEGPGVALGIWNGVDEGVVATTCGVGRLAGWPQAPSRQAARIRRGMRSMGIMDEGK